MFQMSQWVMSIFEPLLSTGSGSCSSTTKLCVPGGTCDHCSAGDTAAGPAACVYLSGITPPSGQAVDVIKSGGTAGPRPAAGGCCALIELLKTPDNSNTASKSAHLIFPSFLVIVILRLQGKDFERQTVAR